MINRVFQLVAPLQFLVKYSEINFNSNSIIVRPTHLSLCHADQRYYLGKRDHNILKAKLPMALIHECTGQVVHDPTNRFSFGDQVVLVPNFPQRNDPIISENYLSDSRFHSSSLDGFMQEYVSLPINRVVDVKNVPFELAAITEFVSVGVHALRKLGALANQRREHIAIWGDGSLAFVMALLIKNAFPTTKISVVGRHIEKLDLFSFVDRVMFDSDLDDNFSFDHAIECTGGSGCEPAIDQIINFINPEGTILLLGVCETTVPIATRTVLEKGLVFIGRSRSGYMDFVDAINLISEIPVQNRLLTLISEVISVRSINDIHTAFKVDLNAPFKTIMRWEI